MTPPQNQSAFERTGVALPASMPADDALVHDFCIELLAGRGRVGDPIWSRAQARLGDQGVVDLTATCGYYGLLAMVMNAARTPPG